MKNAWCEGSREGLGLTIPRTTPWCAANKAVCPTISCCSLTGGRAFSPTAPHIQFHPTRVANFSFQTSNVIANPAPPTPDRNLGSPQDDDSPLGNQQFAVFFLNRHFRKFKSFYRVPKINKQRVLKKKWHQHNTSSSLPPNSPTCTPRSPSSRPSAPTAAPRHSSAPSSPRRESYLARTGVRGFALPMGQRRWWV